MARVSMTLWVLYLAVQGFRFGVVVGFVLVSARGPHE